MLLMRRLHVILHIPHTVARDRVSALACLTLQEGVVEVVEPLLTFSGDGIRHLLNERLIVSFLWLGF